MAQGEGLKAGKTENVRRAVTVFARRHSP